jgi:hypothetical protein
MRSKVMVSVMAGLLVTAIVAIAALAGTRSSSSPSRSMTGMHMHGMTAHTGKTALTKSDLRALLGRQFGAHAILAMNATDAGYSGSPAFAAIAKELDANSVAISKSIGSVYGPAAAKTFLDGKFMWRDHIRFFVAYTGALAKHDKAGQAKAVANLKRYTTVFGNFLATATGLPKPAVRNDLLDHVLMLKNQLDMYAGKHYAEAAAAYTGAYDHMFATADLVAGAIAKQKNLSP